MAAKNSLPKISISKIKEIKKEFGEIMSKPENKENRDDFFLLDKKLIELLSNFEDHSNWFINLFFKNYPY